MNEQFLTSGAGRADNAASDATTMEPAPTLSDVTPAPDADPASSARRSDAVAPDGSASTRRFLHRRQRRRRRGFLQDAEELHIARGAPRERGGPGLEHHLPAGRGIPAGASFPSDSHHGHHQGRWTESTVIMGPCTVTERLKDTGWCPVSGADFTVLENAGSLRDRST